MIECKKYNLNELRETLGFGRRAWETRQEELLEYLGQFFKFEKYTKGRAIIFDIQEQYEEYIPFPSKRDAEKIRQYYSEKTEEVVREKPWNTGSCIARNIILKSENNIYNHKEDTAARYVRGILREEKYFTSQSDSQWMRLSADKLSYVPLTDEETAYLTGLFYSYTEEGRQAREIEKFSEYKSGYITEKELKQFLFECVNYTYESIMSQFKERYGFRPQKIKFLDKEPIIILE